MLKQLLRNQTQLIQMLNPNFKTMGKEKKYDWMNVCLTAISSEAEECRRHLPWKPWKSYKKFALDKDELVEETIDLFHFLLEIWILLDVNEEDIMAVYEYKRLVNMKRWLNDFPELRKHMGSKLLKEVEDVK